MLLIHAAAVDFCSKSFDRLFRQSAKRPNGCIEWTGSLNTDQYGQILVGQNVLRTHRLSFEICVGPIPRFMHVLHKCDNRPCINPLHLFLGTNLDNIADRIAKRRTNRPAKPIRSRANRKSRDNPNNVTHSIPGGRFALAAHVH